MTDPVRRTANRHAELIDEVRAIIARHACRTGRGYIEVCRPRDVELIMYPGQGFPAWSGNNGKVCYPDPTAAGLARDAINALDGGDPVEVYPCPRGDHLHHVAAYKRRAREELIVKQIAAAAQRAADRSGGGL